MKIPFNMTSNITKTSNKFNIDSMTLPVLDESKSSYSLLKFYI